MLCDKADQTCSLVDEITYKKASEAADTATQSAILGPFLRTDHPVRSKGANIHITKGEGAEQLYFFGQVVDAKSGQPLANASVDVWMASTNGRWRLELILLKSLLTQNVGLYEQQDDKQIEHNLRGKFMTDANGEYAFYCIRPTPYPVPFDGPAGK